MLAQASPEGGFPQRAGGSAGVGEAERTGCLLLGLAQPPPAVGSWALPLTLLSCFPHL